MMRQYRNDAFQLSRTLLVDVYAVTQPQLAPPGDVPGLARRLRAAAVAAVARLLEGGGQSTDEDYLRSLEAALSALREVALCVNLCQLRGQLSPATAQALLAEQAEAAAALTALIRSTQALAS